MTDKLLQELISEIKSLHSTIEFMQGDINAIRNGEYDAPRGASSKPRKVPTRTMNTEFQAPASHRP